MPFLLIFALFAVTPVSLSVYPESSLPPATFRVLVIVPRHAENRRLCVGYHGPEDRRSCVQLDGELARRSYTAYWSLRASGEYEAVAVVTRMEAGRERSYVETRVFKVLGGMEP